MPGSAAAVGIVAGVAVLAAALATVGGAAVTGQRLASAADAGALAAADAASGAVPGDPCERAAEVAETFGGRVEACDLDELIATVTVSMPLGPLTARASARAGPPPAGSATTTRAIIEAGKWDYLFGRVTSGAAHNVARPTQNAQDLGRIGILDNATGRQLLSDHFDEVVNTANNNEDLYE